MVIYEGKLDHRYWVLSTSLVWIFALSLKYLTQQQTAPIVATMLPSLMGLFLMIVFAPKVDTELGSKKSWQWWSKRTGQNFGILLSLTVCFGILVSWIHGENLVVSSKRYLGVFHQMLKQEVD